MRHAKKAEDLRERITRANLHRKCLQARPQEVDEIQIAIQLLDEIRSYGPDARLRVNARGRSTFTVYDPTKPAKARK